MDRAVRDWAARAARERLEVLRIGYFGSYARGDAICLPVPADVLVYTQAEWERMEREGRVARAPWRDTVWVYGR